MMTHEKEAAILAPLYESLVEEEKVAAQKKNVVEETLLVVKPDAVAHHAQILLEADRAGFSIECSSMVFTRRMAAAVAAALPAPADAAAHAERAQQWRQQNVDHLLSGTVLAVVLRRTQAVSALLSLLGPPAPADARAAAPASLRARFGSDAVRNAAYCSTSVEQARRDIISVMGYAPPRPPPAAGGGGSGGGGAAAALAAAEEEEEAAAAAAEGGGGGSGGGGSGPGALAQRAKRELEALQEERRQLRQREAELARREAAEAARRLHPAETAAAAAAAAAASSSPVAARRLPAGGAADAFGCAPRVIRHYASGDATGLPLTPRGLREVFDDLDAGGEGRVPREAFRELYTTCPPLENFGVPGDLKALDKRLEGYGESGLTFDDFCIQIYQAARR